ncbi:hypothetical protein BH18ACT4_BH18ACT4_04380 [soil metagenome]
MELPVRLMTFPGVGSAVSRPAAARLQRGICRAQRRYVESLSSYIRLILGR